jgi:hypothetical protein
MQPLGDSSAIMGNWEGVTVMAVSKEKWAVLDI